MQCRTVHFWLIGSGYDKYLRRKHFSDGNSQNLKIYCKTIVSHNILKTVFELPQCVDIVSEVLL